MTFYSRSFKKILMNNCHFLSNHSCKALIDHDNRIQRKSSTNACVNAYPRNFFLFHAAISIHWRVYSQSRSRHRCQTRLGARLSMPFITTTEYYISMLVTWHRWRRVTRVSAKSERPSLSRPREMRQGRRACASSHVRGRSCYLRHASRDLLRALKSQRYLIEHAGR